MQKTIYLVNPPADVPDRSAHQYRDQKWLFSFGPYADTQCIVWGRCLEGALEKAADWLCEHAPGHFADPDYAAAAEELGLDPRTDDPEEQERIVELAETDLTYTAAGYLLSWEWGVHEIHRADMCDLRRQGVEFLIA